MKRAASAAAVAIAVGVVFVMSVSASAVHAAPVGKSIAYNYGTFCIAGKVTNRTVQEDMTAGIVCTNTDARPVAVWVELDGGAPIGVFKSTSPNQLVCTSATLAAGSHVTLCGNLVGFQVNAGTPNQASGFNLYPQTLTRP